MDLKYRIDINASPKVVFGLVSDIERMPEWRDNLTASEYVSGFDSREAVGTAFRQRASAMGRDIEYDGEITAYDPPARIGLMVVGKDLSFMINIDFIPRNQGVPLQYSAKMTGAPLATRLLASAFSSTAGKILKKQLNNLKTLAESSA